VIALDTNVLVRYIVQDDPAQAAKAARLIEQQCTESRPGFIPAIVLVELVWVLDSCYGSARAQLVSVLEQIMRTRQVLVQDAEIVWQAVRRFATSRADFADCLVDSVARAHGCEYTATFDKAAAAAGMRLIE
jgi:predicted nucleic-acid-binding protein